jgi:hypothetical protein
MSIKNELQSIISGEGKVEHGTIIQAATSYLKRSQSTGTMAQDYQSFKRQENESLTAFISDNNLWLDNIDFDSFVSQGAEQRVFLKDGKSVLKLNDAIYYHSWVDYFHNLLLNNYFFPDTAYRLNGFHNQDDIIYAVVEQAFVKATERTELENVKKFMEQNGFLNIKNNDYFNPELGIILEDLHDENVLTENGLLRFIDTVFYIKDWH